MSSISVNVPMFLYQQDGQDIPDVRAVCVNLAMPSLYEFGRMILEIVTWRPCSSDGNDITQRLQELQDEDANIAHADEILVAVAACLGYGDDRLKGKSKQDTIRESITMRAYFTDIVIRNLEDVLSKAYRMDVSKVFPTVNSDTRLAQRSDIAKKSGTDPDRRKSVRFSDNTTPIPGPGKESDASTELCFTLLNDDTGEDKKVGAKMSVLTLTPLLV